MTKFQIKKRKNPNGKPKPSTMQLKELQEKFPFVQWKKFIENYLGSVFVLEEDTTVIFQDEFYFDNIGELVKNTPIR